MPQKKGLQRLLAIFLIVLVTAYLLIYSQTEIFDSTLLALLGFSVIIAFFLVSKQIFKKYDIKFPKIYYSTIYLGLLLIIVFALVRAFIRF